MNVILSGWSNELKLRNSSLTVISSSLDLTNGIACDGSVPMTLEISDSKISSSSRTSVTMDVNSEQVTLSIRNSSIAAHNQCDGITISAYSSVVLVLENSSVLATPAVTVNSEPSNSNLTAMIRGSWLGGSVKTETAYTVSEITWLSFFIFSA